ncbi:unnamed protein product, partial [marine sediment metagenome]
SENEKGLGIVTSESIWDLLPEDFPYEDHGCELFPSCLNCPFPHCIKEEPWGKEKFLKTDRARRMMSLKKEGKDNEEIARIFRVSVRTVQRWLKAVKTGMSNPP